MQPPTTFELASFPSLYVEEITNENVMLQPGHGSYSIDPVVLPTQDLSFATDWHTTMQPPIGARDYGSATISFHDPGPAAHTEIMLQTPPASDPLLWQGASPAADLDMLQSAVGAYDFHSSALPIEVPGSGTDRNTTMQLPVGVYQHNPTAINFHFHITGPDGGAYWVNRRLTAKRRYFSRGRRYCQGGKEGCDPQEPCSHCTKHTIPFDASM